MFLFIFYRNSTTKLEYFNSLFTEGKALQPILDVKTRWNTVFDMIERILNISNEFNQTLIKFNMASDVITMNDINTLLRVKNFLELFKDCTLRVSDER